MLIMLFLGDAVDEARRPDCWLVVVTEINHVGPGPSWGLVFVPGCRHAMEAKLTKERQ
jgi:hypothetical protein